jgi:hypothetical protein
MNRYTFAFAASTLLLVGGPAYAQHGHGGAKPATTPSGSHGASTTHGSSAATTHGQSGSHGAATQPTSSGSTHGAGNSHESGSGGTHSTAATTKSSTPTSTTPSGTGSTTTLTPVQQKLQQNTNLADKLRTRLPDGTNVMDAAAGFRNLGQFVAAVNVSNNLHLDFTELKTHMVDDGMSLGQAIQRTKPTANAETEAHRAETEADVLIKSTTSTSSSSTSTTTTSTKTTKKTTGTR